MALRSRTILKAYFKKYATPTPAQYGDLIDSFAHLAEDIVSEFKNKLSVDNIAGLGEKIKELKESIPAAPTAENIKGLDEKIKEIKADLLKVINESTAARYVRQVESFAEIEEPQPGMIVQYIGKTNEALEHFRAFFYEYGEKEPNFNASTPCFLVYNGTGIFKSLKGEPNAVHPTTQAECYAFFPCFPEDFKPNGTNIVTDYQGNYLLAKCAGDFAPPATAQICDEYGDVAEGAKMEKGIFGNLNSAVTYAARGCFEIPSAVPAWNVIRVSPVL